MTRSVPFLLRPAAAVALAFAVSLPAQARNDTFMVAVSDVINKSRTREIVGALPLRFGAASAPERGSPDIIRPDVVVEGVGSAGGDDPRQHRIGPPLTDEERCAHAFEDALARLVAAAREVNAAAIVGVESDYKNAAPIPDGRTVECHAGGVRSFVWLRAQLVRSLAPARPLPAGTSFAPLGDVDAVPISDAGKERYRHFLTLPSPRAFVIYEDGNWRFYWKDPEAVTKALDHCARQGKRCWLYAADDRVVWSPDVDKRIGSSAQLGGAAAADPKDEHQ
ncbi:MAG: hypothetical protein JF585_08895 [Burkholderiales bacterium]|nr:hypothetical protein [Burkholderiales bacterium]